MTSWCQILPTVSKRNHLLPVVTSSCRAWQAVARYDQLLLDVTSCCQVWPAVTRYDQLLPGVTSCCQVWLTDARCDYLLPGESRCCQVWPAVDTLPGVTNCCQVWQTGFRCDQVVKVVTRPGGQSCDQVVKVLTWLSKLWPARARCKKLLPVVTSCCQVHLTVAMYDHLVTPPSSAIMWHFYLIDLGGFHIWRPQNFSDISIRHYTQYGL